MIWQIFLAQLHAREVLWRKCQMKCAAVSLCAMQQNSVFIFFNESDSRPLVYTIMKFYLFRCLQNADLFIFFMRLFFFLSYTVSIITLFFLFVCHSMCLSYELTLRLQQNTQQHKHLTSGRSKFFQSYCGHKILFMKVLFEFEKEKFNEVCIKITSCIFIHKQNVFFPFCSKKFSAIE